MEVIGKMFNNWRNNGDKENDKNPEDAQQVEDPGEGSPTDDSGSMNLPGLGSVKKNNEEKDPAEALKHKDLDGAQELEQILKENPEIIEQYNMTWSIQQVQGFLPNINPSYIRARTEKAKTEAMAEANNDQLLTGDRVMLLGIFLIIGAIAFVIIKQGTGGGSGGGPAKNVAQGAGASISILGASLKSKYSQWRTE